MIEASADLISVPPNPYDLFRSWYDEALADERIEMADAIALATCNSLGVLSNRMVLMKSYDEQGVVFATNYASRKGQDLKQNPQAALLWWWPVLGRQVRMEGAVDRVSESESDQLFNDRPLASRVAACLSKQSSVIKDREQLLQEHRKLLQKGAPTRPNDWGGFRLRPFAIEFWLSRPSRMHDRWHYRQTGQQWQITRLSP